MLSETLMKNELVDEYRFMIYPIVLGTGKKFFKEGVNAKLKLLEMKKFDSGVVLMAY